MPQRQHLVGQVEADLLESRDRPKLGVAKDEGAVRRGHRATLRHRRCRPGTRRPGTAVTMTPMEIQFLGGATTVTGSQYLLVTERARILIDCGMFQGSPNEIDPQPDPVRVRSRRRSMPSC